MEATVHAAAADHADIVGLRPVVYGLDAALLLLAATNLVACVVIGLRERVRELGLLKAVGLTPAQIGASFASAQALVAAGAVTLGVPLGLGLFRLGAAASGGGSLAYPALWKLALLAVAAPPFVVLLGAPAARRTAAIPVADALRVD
jgi:putative ABC transport system permease protein